MNQDRAKHLLPIIEHLANGGSMDDVQERYCIDAWIKVQGNIFFDDTDYTYRLKAQQIEMWVNEYSDRAGGFGNLHVTKGSAIQNKRESYIATRRVTVHPEDES